MCLELTPVHTFQVYTLQLFVNTSSQAEEFRVFCVESSKFVSGQLPRVSASDPNCKKRTMPAKPKCFPQSTVSAPSVPFNPSHAKSRGSLQRSSAPGAAKPPKSLHRTAAPATPPSPLSESEPHSPVQLKVRSLNVLYGLQTVPLALKRGYRVVRLERLPPCVGRAAVARMVPATTLWTVRRR